MGKFIPVDKFERWWRKAQGWFVTQFASINVDLTPVEEKLDDIEEAVENIHVDSESADQLAAFFNITPPVPNAVPMTQQEVEDDLDELWNLIITQ